MKKAVALFIVLCLMCVAQAWAEETPESRIKVLQREIQQINNHIIKRKDEVFKLQHGISERQGEIKSLQWIIEWNRKQNEEALVDMVATTDATENAKINTEATTAVAGSYTNQGDYTT